jgi:hypothetical protein
MERLVTAEKMTGDQATRVTAAAARAKLLLDLVLILPSETRFRRNTKETADLSISDLTDIV